MGKVMLRDRQAQHHPSPLWSWVSHPQPRGLPIIGSSQLGPGEKS